MTTAIQIEEPTNIDLARFDDDGGTRHQSTVETHPLMRDGRISTPMIPVARGPEVLTMFGVAAIVSGASSVTMDAATIAAHQRAGGGAPNQRRPPRVGSRWQRLGRRMRMLRLLIGVD